MNARAKQRPAAGYTVIELLVVLLLVGLIASAIGAGLHMGTRAWEHSERRISDIHADLSAQGILRALLGAAVPRVRGGTVTFEGRPDGLAFDATPPAAFGASGLARVELSIVPGAEGTRLLLKVTSLVDRGRTRAALLDGDIGDLRFAYLDASEKVPTWLAFWRDRERLPDAVRLDAGGRPGRRTWSGLVVRLPLMQSADCVFDPVSTDCRRS